MNFETIGVFDKEKAHMGSGLNGSAQYFYAFRFQFSERIVEGIHCKPPGNVPADIPARTGSIANEFQLVFAVSHKGDFDLFTLFETAHKRQTDYVFVKPDGLIQIFYIERAPAKIHNIRLSPPA